MKKSSFYLLGAGFIVFSFMIGCAGSKNDKKENSVVGVPRGAGGQKPQGGDNKNPAGKTNPDGTQQPGGDKGGPSSTAGGDQTATGSKCVATLSMNADDMMDEESAKIEDMKDGSDKKWILGKTEIYATSGKVDSTEDDTQLSGASGKIKEELKLDQKVTTVGSISCAYSSKTNIDVPEQHIVMPYMISAKDGKTLLTRTDIFSAQNNKKVVTTSLSKPKEEKQLDESQILPSSDSVMKITKTKDGNFIIRWEAVKTVKVDGQEFRTVLLMRATYGLAK